MLTLQAAPINERELASAILAEVAKKLNQGLVGAVGRIQTRVAAVIEDAITASPEYHGLVGGQLQGELGVVDPERAVRGIIDAIVENVKVESLGASISGGAIGGGLVIRILKSDFSDASSANGVSFLSEQNYRIDWLDWLLTKGDEIIVVDYEFQAGSFRQSRTGLGIMAASKRGWKVPQEFVGTPADNWLTRALEKAEPEIEAAIGVEIGRMF